MNVATLTALQRRILALLEEAGEDDLSALTNSVGARVGSFAEVEEMTSALADLVRFQFVLIATERDESTLRWIPLTPEKSLMLLESANKKFQWSTVEKLWKWPMSQTRFEVLLTLEGVRIARAVLALDGWPT